MRARALRVAALATLAQGCAGVGAHASFAAPYRFPPAFRASQVVTLDEPGGRHELIASVRRSGNEEEVTLFDPVFAVPLLSARAVGDEVTEELLAPGPHAGDGKRLVALLRDVFGREYPERDGSAEAKDRAGRIRLSGLAPLEETCRFPTEVEIVPRLGELRVRVRTLDVSCGR